MFPKCKSIGCHMTAVLQEDYCFVCKRNRQARQQTQAQYENEQGQLPLTPQPPTMHRIEPQKVEVELSGGSNPYYSVGVSDPISGGDPYAAECGDIIEALRMDFNEGNAFKAIWRKCAARTLGLTKKGNTPLYDAEKVVYFGERMLAVEQRNQAEEKDLSEI